MYVFSASVYLSLRAATSVSSCNTAENKEDAHEGHDHSEGTHVHDDGTVHEGDHHQEEFEASEDTLAQ